MPDSDTPRTRRARAALIEIRNEAPERAGEIAQHALDNMAHLPADPQRPSLTFDERLHLVVVLCGLLLVAVHVDGASSSAMAIVGAIIVLAGMMMTGLAKGR